MVVQGTVVALAGTSCEQAKGTGVVGA